MKLVCSERPSNVPQIPQLECGANWDSSPGSGLCGRQAQLGDCRHTSLSQEGQVGPAPLQFIAAAWRLGSVVQAGTLLQAGRTEQWLRTSCF